MRKSLIPQTPVIKKNQDESQAARTNDGKLNSSESPVGKRKPIKVDLKLDYMQNQIDEIKNFKDFLQHINYSTKDLIKPQNNKINFNQNDTGSQKRRNSFSLNDQMFKNNLNEHEKHNSKCTQKSDPPVSSSKAQQKNETKDPYDKQKIKDKQIDLARLCEITKIVQSKKSLLNTQIAKLKERMLHSSMWEDKQFYDFTEFNYGIKMTEIEQRLEVSEKNLQQKEKQKKMAPQIMSKNSPNQAYIVRYGLHEADTKQGASIAQYFDVKSKILNELKHINRIYCEFQTLKANDSFKIQPKIVDKKHLSQSRQSSQNQQTVHPIIASTKLMISQFQKFAEIIKAYRAHSKKRQQKYKNQPSDITKLLYYKVRTLNKEILQKELSTTQNQISKLKHQTETIENGIKELQAFKALTLLRNKTHEQSLKYQKKGNSIKKSNKTSFDDEVLRVILEHQFLVKNRALRIQTKFSGIEKRNIRSNSEPFASRQPNHFRNIKIQRKCLSVKQIGLKSLLGQNSTKDKIEQPIKPHKRNGLQIVSTLSTKKQTGSSAQTNP